MRDGSVNPAYLDADGNIACPVTILVEKLLRYVHALEVEVRALRGTETPLDRCEADWLSDEARFIEEPE